MRALPKGWDLADPIPEGFDVDGVLAEADVYEPEAEAAVESNIPAYCDEALTLAFSARHADDLRHCETFGGWLEWDEGRWREDGRRRVFSLARQLCREKSSEALMSFGDRKTGIKVASAIASAKTVAAIVNLARADARHATIADDWDADQWALNTPGGIVDLRSGEMRPHDRKALCSKITAVAPASTGCPRWHRFLDEVTGGDADLQAFLRRIAGYSLTGSTREHALFFLYGTGANGKGTFLNTLTAVLADYSRTAPMEVFTDNQGDRHPTELAMLRGARLVAAQETEAGRRWAESKIKALTGGDPVSARFMRQDFFTYTPQFKLVIAGNHKPGLRGVDEAIRRRFHLLPFTVCIPPDRRDPTLFDALKAEWPAILQWAIDGCLEWQRVGLAPPSAVVSATEEYFGDEDSVGTWLADRTEHAPSGFERTRDLYGAWKTWAERTGERVGTERAFAQALKNRGIEQRRDMHGRGFVGISLIRHDYTDDARYGG